MMIHLLTPHDSSINNRIDKEEFTLCYTTINDAVQMINQLGSILCLLKLTLKVPFTPYHAVQVEDRELLGIHWRQKYYMNCCPPFGLWSALFTICRGIGMDSWSQLSLCLPHDKLEALISFFRHWSNTKNETTKRELLSPIGMLSLAAKVIPASHIFLRRVIDLNTSVKKLHHHTTLTAGARADIQWWQDVLPGENAVSLMLQADWRTTADPNLFTDAPVHWALELVLKEHGSWTHGQRRSSQG